MSKIVVVTGAGGGLGRALAQALVQRGDSVVGIGRNLADLQETGLDATADAFTPAVADVADFAALQRAVDATIERHGRIDGLFANAAVYPRLAVLDHDPQAWMDAIATNVGGAYASARAVLPSMLSRARGRIILVGSFAWRLPIRDSSAYSVSKGALHVLAKSLAVEVGGDYPDILVNEWVPGALRTRMGIESGIEPELAATWGLQLLDAPAGGPSGEVYDRNQLVLPPRSLKRRIVDKLLRR